MCGIFGIIDKNDVVEKALKGLHTLEYRGYDSAGIVFEQDENLKSIKAVGEIEKLKVKVFEENPKSNCVIAHTRWATHGKPSLENAHPFLSDNKNFALVHNGIIENYITLKNEYLKGVKLQSETDSEIVVQLLEKFYDGDTLTAIKKVTNLLVGSFTLAIINKNEKNVIYSTKKDTPLVVGVGRDKKELLVASDVSAILPFTNNPIIVPDNHFVKISLQDGLQFYNEGLQVVKLKPIFVNDDDSKIEKNGFKHFMLKEIFEIPKCIRRLLKEYPSKSKIFENLPIDIIKNLKKIVFVACGTAYHAGLVGQYLCDTMLNLQTESYIASEFRYSEKQIEKDALYVFITQSGETADTLAALKRVKENGAKTLSIVNARNSRVTYESDFVMYTYAGVEVGIASTKAYNSQIALMYLLAAAMLEVRKTDNINQYQKTLKSINEMFENEKMFQTFKTKAKSLAKKYHKVSKVFLLGRQLDFLTAMEGALKLKEITYISCEGYPAGELKHGPISLVDNNTLIICFNTQQAVSEKTLNAVYETKSRGASVLTITKFENKELLKAGNDFVLLPNFEDVYMPLVSIIPLQMFAYFTSLELGYNPDKPRNLAKSVTVE